MSSREKRLEYVIKSGRDYIRTVFCDAPQYWTPCQHCARRFTREHAHRLHWGKDGYKVIRIVPRGGA